MATCNTTWMQREKYSWSYLRVGLNSAEQSPAPLSLTRPVILIFVARTPLEILAVDHGVPVAFGLKTTVVNFSQTTDKF